TNARIALRKFPRWAYVAMLALFLVLFSLNEREGCGVHAIALAGRGGTIVEHVTQVGVATAANHFRARAEPATVFQQSAIVFIDRLPEARPAGSRIKLWR